MGNVLKGALSVGGAVLNPDPTLGNLRRAKEEIKDEIKIAFIEVAQDMGEIKPELSLLRNDIEVFRDPNFFTSAMKSSIVEFILRGGFISKDGKVEVDKHDNEMDEEFNGLDTLLEESVFVSAFPLHDKETRQTLKKNWGSLLMMHHIQPLEEIRDYYGEKMALYFALLGYYTTMLVFPAVMGVCCFIYGMATYSKDVPSEEICSEAMMGNTRMCPLADGCQTWSLKKACSKERYYSDNTSSVVFAFLMAMWSAVFLEGWKRYSSRIRYRWGDVEQLAPEAEHSLPQYLRRVKKLDKELQLEHPMRPSF